MSPPGQDAIGESRPDDEMTSRIGESRWPPTIAVTGFLTFNVSVRIWIPGEHAFRLPWLLPAVELVLLAVQLTGNPGGVVSRARTHRLGGVRVSCRRVASQPSLAQRKPTFPVGVSGSLAIRAEVR